MPKTKNSSDKTMISLRLTRSQLDRLDEWMERTGKLNRSEALRGLITASLNTSEMLPTPAWMERLCHLASRMNTDEAGAVDMLADFLSEPEQPGTQNVANMDRATKRGVFRGLIGL